MKHFKENSYTLLEVLVAVAVLVIMMGFLFQFAGSAQKLWSTNTGRTEMSMQADAVFSILGEDLEHAYIVSGDEDVDAQAGWYCLHKPKGSTNPPLFSNSDEVNLKDLCFFVMDPEWTENSSKSMVYGVRYHFEQETEGEDFKEGRGKLYRYESDGQHWEKIGDRKYPSSKTNFNNPDLFYNLATATNMIEHEKIPETNIDKIPDDPDYLLAENIRSIRIESDAWKDKEGNSATLPLMRMPRFIRIIITFSVPEHLRNGSHKETEMDQTFTRTFLLKH